MKRLAEKLKAGAAVGVTWLPDVLIAGGAIAISFGAALVYQPAGWIVGGVLAVAGGVLLARGAQ